MSDDIEITIPGAESSRPDPAQVRRDNLARARAAKVAKRTLTPRQATTRAATDARTARPTDAPATRATTAREPSLPEAPTRRARHERQVGAMELPAHLKKPGWDYQWIAIRVLNQGVDPSELRDYREQGWRPSKAKDWPDLSDPSDSADTPIESRGFRLHERPMSLTREAQQEDLNYAQQQQRDRMVAAASGKSAVRGEEGIPTGRATRVVPLEISLEGVAG